MKKILLFLFVIISVFSLTGCGSKKEQTILISDVDKGTRWEAITKYDITLIFEDGKCVSENYYLEFIKETNAIVYGMEMEGQSYIEDYKQEGNVVTYKRTGLNNEFEGRTVDDAYKNAQLLYPKATVSKQ